jgi:FG-GAP repeat protein
MSVPFSAEVRALSSRADSGRSEPAAGSRWRRCLPAVLAVPLVAVLGVAGTGVAVADSPDFSLTVGIPNAGSGAGEVENRSGTECCTQLLTQQLPAESGARFGASAVSSYDLNGDEADDMLVGAPGTPGLGGGGQTGRVHVFYGSVNGVLTAGGVLENHAEPGDEFGAALAVGWKKNTETRYGVRELWIGAPGHDVAGKVDAGAVFRYDISEHGITYVETVTQDSPLVPGVAEAGDRFGEVLAIAGMVGVPSEDIGTAKDAGTVLALRIDDETDALIMGTEWNQNTAGVPGVAEAGDRFGAALSGGAVGVPGEDIGTVKDAGIVQILGGPAISQNSRWIPGKVEAGDRFGAAVSMGYRIQDYDARSCFEMDSLAIGVPGEDIGSVKDAGAVLLTQPRLRQAHFNRNLDYCPPEALSQGDGLPGKAEAGDQVGATLGLRPGDAEAQNSQRDTLLIGVPGEDVAAVKDAGRVISRSRDEETSIGYSGGDVGGMRFGTFLIQGEAY